MKLSLIAILAIAFASPAAARVVTVTGAHGGTSVSTGSCQVMAGKMVCSSQVLATGAKGRTAVINRTTTAGGGQIVRTIAGTTSGGRTIGRTTTITR